ncbi:MAG: hypothetical protein JOZ00_09540 [Mycobacterium sp.]|uniref:hypothetical protein n=1 Tax=Mycobacterium sp. TaxID=1785 RepID=UPI001ECE3785|nr:hypothetical protein [Mycobacterium sp.]MBV8786918.1 hypothetical protein [Mycobacterium sp.]
MSARVKILIAIALGAILAGGCGAIAYGFWGVSQDCHQWANSRGYELLHDAWWAKTRGCTARTADGAEVFHSEQLGDQAIGWPWQAAIFATGTLPAVIIVAVYAIRWRKGSPGADT